MSKGPEGAPQIPETKQTSVLGLRERGAWHELKLERWAEIRPHGSFQAEGRAGSLILRTMYAVLLSKMKTGSADW